MMNNKFDIAFDLSISESKVLSPMKAHVEQHASGNYFIVTNLEIQTSGFSAPSYKSFFITKIEIKPVERDGKRLWVHCDSEKMSELSGGAGQAIDSYITL